MRYEVKIKKGEDVITLPKGRLLELLSECSEEELKALIAICAVGDAEQACGLCSLDSHEFSEALSFWRGAKMITRAKKSADLPAKEEQDKKEQTKKEHTKEAEIPDSIPEYTSADVKRLSENDALFSSILSEAQQTFGKVFNNVEMNYMLAMRDHLALDGEYILMLLEYFRREGKPLCYVVRVADSLVKQGVSDPRALEEYLMRRDAFKGNEGRYRDLFGIGARRLTAYEEKYFSSWSEDMKIPFELVKIAFDRTVEKKGTPQKSYINGILRAWHEAGIKTEEELCAFEERGRAEKSAPAPQKGTSGESTFDVNEFFFAALERTYSDDNKKTDGSDGE